MFYHTLNKKNQNFLGTLPPDPYWGTYSTPQTSSCNFTCLWHICFRFCKKPMRPYFFLYYHLTGGKMTGGRNSGKQSQFWCFLLIFSQIRFKIVPSTSRKWKTRYLAFNWKSYFCRTSTDDSRHQNALPPLNLTRILMSYHKRNDKRKFPEKQEKPIPREIGQKRQTKHFSENSHVKFT